MEKKVNIKKNITKQENFCQRNCVLLFSKGKMFLFSLMHKRFFRHILGGEHAAFAQTCRSQYCQMKA